ncbi:hypothetical protein [Streptomyces mirabilis]|uniref:hypothetical protein n=1 Tax=Streptomyces mirabilis TaxID=68239 RepID=UPI0036A372DD
MSQLFASISAAFDAVAAEAEAERLARYNSPEARAARSARSQKAAATLRARRAAAALLEAEREAREPVGPACGLFGIIPLPHGPHETTCVRPPHRHGDHENIDGDQWPTYDEEFDDMLKVTTTHLRELLDSRAIDPVLYIARDEDTGEQVRLEVGPDAYAPNDDIIGHRHELVDGLGGPNHPDGVTEDALENQVEGWQNVLAVTVERDLMTIDTCVDGKGDDYPEHDFPDEEGSECRRCGAEAEDGDGPDGIYDGEVR